MIIEQKGSELINSHEFKTSNFGVDDEDMPFLISLLRDKIYSDKMAAVIREYGTNAVDAHIEAGYPEKPFRITLPTRLNQEFKVRDFGLGMSHEKIDKLYTKYCKSTKRNSNDSNGAWGLGCKAGFAYGDNFVVVSYFDNKKSTYNIVAGPDGSGQAILLDESESDEHSGVEIIIPVPDHEISSFRDKAASIYKHFRVQPEVEGSPKDFNMDFNVVFEGDFWKLLEKNRGPYWRAHANPIAVMGDVAYPINKSLLDIKFSHEYNYLSSVSLVLNFEIGDLDINPSRESLEYTEKTYEAIQARLIQFQNSFSSFASQEISGAKDLLSAYKKLKTFLSDLPKTLTKSKTTIPFKWKGIDLDKDCVISANDGVSAAAFGFRNRHGQEKFNLTRINYANSKGTSYIEISDKYKYFFIPCGEKFKNKTYSVEQYFEDNGKEESLMIFSFDTQEAYDTFVKKNNVQHYGADQFQSIKTIEKEKPKIVVDGKSRNIDYCPKRNCKIFKFNKGVDDKSCWDAVPKKDVPKTGYYVEINRYVPVGHGCAHLDNYNLKEKVELMAKMIGINAPEIYGIKTADVHKFEDSWIEIGSWFLDHVDEFKKSKEVKDAIRNDARRIRPFCGVGGINDLKIGNNHIIDRTVKFFRKSHELTSHSLLYGFPHEFEEAYEKENARLDLREKVNLRIKRINREYPLIPVIENSYRNCDSSYLAEYVKGVDCLRNSQKKS